MSIIKVNEIRDLSNNSLVKQGEIEKVVDTIADLLAVPVEVVKSVRVLNYHDGIEGGGGVFYWNPDKPKADHNGGTVIDPVVNFPYTWSNTTQQATWFDGTESVDNGCWIRQYEGAVNVKWFGAKGDGVTDDTKGIQSTIGHKYVALPEGTFYITAPLVLSSGDKLVGVKPHQDNTRFATSGTILKPSPTLERIVDIQRPSDTADSVVLSGLAFSGENNDYAIYSNGSRHSTFKDIIFNNFKTCMHFESENWLNTFSSIQAYDFDIFAYFNSGGEDSTIRNVLARGYRTGSIGVFINYYSQTMYLEGCDLSECSIGYLASIGVGNHCPMFKSCYFEVADQVTNGAVVLSASNANISATFEGCRFFFKGTVATDVKAVSTNGTGNVDVTLNSCYFTDMDTLIFDTNNSSLSTCRGQGNIVEGIAPTVYGNTSNSIKKLSFIGEAELLNLQSIDAEYLTLHDFTNPFNLDMSSVGNSGKWEVEVVGSNEPINNAKYLFQPKSYFSNGSFSEVYDLSSAFTPSISGDTITLSSGTAGTCRVLVTKII